MPEKTDDLGYLLTVANKVLRKMLVTQLQEFDLTDRQFGILHKLSEEDGISTKDLIERMFSDNSTIVAIIDRMEQKGLVKRRPDVNDRRITRVFLTQKAKTLLPKVMRRADAFNQVILERLTTNEKQALKSALGKIASMVPEKSH